MKPSVTPSTATYTQWFNSFRALLPGSIPTLRTVAIRKQDRAAASQQWEDVGGSVRRVPMPGSKEATKIPR
jgi:hypothetical protein